MRYLFLFVLLLVLAGTARAAERFELKEAVSLALKKNHLLEAADHERTAAEAGVAIRRSRYMPKLLLEERADITNSPVRAFMMRLDEGRFSLAGDLNHPKTTGDFQTSLLLEQPLFDVGVARMKAVAEQELVSQSQALEQRREDVAFQVYAAYLAVQRAQAQLTVVEQAVADAREHQRQAAVRSAAGTGLRYDELRIGTFLTETELQKISAENELRIARLRFGQVIGLPAGSAPEIGKPVKGSELGYAGEDLAKMALSNRHDLKESEAVVAKADEGVAVARGSYWPTIYASAGYQMNDRDIPFGRDNDSWVVGASLRWELFDGLRRRSEVSKARAERDAAEAYLQNQRQEVALQLQESMLRRDEASKRLEVAHHAVKDAEEMVRLMNKRFENALATTVEVLDAQTTLNRARAQLVENEANQALATASVYRNAGLFLKEIMQ